MVVAVLRQTPKKDVFWRRLHRTSCATPETNLWHVSFGCSRIFAKSVAVNATYKMISQAVGHVALGRQDADSHSDSLTPPQVEHICRSAHDHLRNGHCNGLHRLVVRTSRWGRDNPGSTPGGDISKSGSIQILQFLKFTNSKTTVRHW